MAGVLRHLCLRVFLGSQHGFSVEQTVHDLFALHVSFSLLRDFGLQDGKGQVCASCFGFPGKAPSAEPFCSVRPFLQYLTICFRRTSITGLGSLRQRHQKPHGPLLRTSDKGLMQ
jgi:hypothetical protein